MKTNSKMVDVLIQGAGLGGLSMALTLKQQGLSVLVLERQKGLSEVGAGIWMAPNALQVFKTLRLDQKIASLGWAIERVRLKDSKYKDLQVSDLSEASAIFGFGTVAIERLLLQKILFDALGASDVLFDDEIASVHASVDQVKSTLKSGIIVESKLLIGADGIHSQVRDLIGLASEKRYSGTSSFRGIAEAQMPVEAKHDSWEIWAGEYRLGFSQVAENRLYWYMTFKSPQNQVSDGIDKWKDAKKIVEKRFRDYQRVVEKTDPNKVIRTDLSDLVRLPSWSKGRIGLIGDAAHATTPNLGQGGAMAIEDAFMLGECIRETGLNPQAFEQFEKARREKVDWTVSMSWKIGQLAHAENPIVCAIRNAVLRLTPASYGKKQWMKMYQLERTR